MTHPRPARSQPPVNATLIQLSEALEQGRCLARDLVERCLDRIEDPAGEGVRAFTRVDAEAARACADAQDLLRRHGAAPSRWAGIPISIKDLFDIQGQPTHAGSQVLRGIAPASADAPAVARLRQAGMVLIGRTQMPEFAFSALGLNPHDGTPLNPWNRHEARVPGGSSSGAAVAVKEGMAEAALGSDTGGSCRIPAAFCGLVGFKPTARSVPQQGMVPLSPSLDAVGPLARSVDCCSHLYGLLSSTAVQTTRRPTLAGLRLGLPQTLVMDGLDPEVSAAFEQALSRLRASGVHIVELPMKEFADVPRMNARGGFAAAESLAWHRPWIARSRDRYDPLVLERIERGGEMSALDYQDLLADRQRFIAAVNGALNPVDALVMPTCAIVAPKLEQVHESPAAFAHYNLMSLRNAALVNLFDGCAITLPIEQPGAAPVGLSLAMSGGSDAALLAMAASIELGLRGTSVMP